MAVAACAAERRARPRRSARSCGDRSGVTSYECQCFEALLPMSFAVTDWNRPCGQFESVSESCRVRVEHPAREARELAFEIEPFRGKLDPEPQLARGLPGELFRQQNAVAGKCFPRDM